MSLAKNTIVFLCLSLFVLTCVAAAQTTKIPLGGEWLFALDPVDAGVEQEWFAPGFASHQGIDKVVVPHCFSVDPRYHRHTGSAWYFKKFDAAPPAADERVFIHFDAAFYHATVWLDGKRLGEHEGGYTPFEFDATALLTGNPGGKHVLAVRVNNAWSTRTIPGAKTPVAYQNPIYGQSFPWINYGGLTRPVSLVTRPGFHISKAKVEAVPDLTTKTATLRARVWVRNMTARSWSAKDVALAVYRIGVAGADADGGVASAGDGSAGAGGEAGEKIAVPCKVTGGEIAPQSGGVFQIEAALDSAATELWSFDHPALYVAEITAGKDTRRVSFGIRGVEVRGTRLLLNGEPVSLGGCNRPLDYPGLGSMDPEHVLEKDLRLIKSGGMELSRISHYPVSTELLDWADRHGLLLIGEAGNWQMTPAQMDDPELRAKFQAQMREMVERDWNHPSLIAWSMGNEYQSQTPAGQAWTRDMAAFVKSLDASRLVTFSSNVVFRPEIKSPGDEASQYVDFVSANIYDDHLNALQKIHALHPGKPVYVSEFGLRADKVGDERDRVAHLRRAMAGFRECADFLIGASVWTFNDYQSTFPGTNADGCRPYGLVTPDRTPRAMYHAWQEEFSPATVTLTKPDDSGAVRVRVAARKDFPRYTLRNCKLRAGGHVFDIPALAPGESVEFVIPPGSGSARLAVELEKPGGFVILKLDYGNL